MQPATPFPAPVAPVAPVAAVPVPAPMPVPSPVQPVPSPVHGALPTKNPYASPFNPAAQRSPFTVTNDNALRQPIQLHSPNPPPPHSHPSLASSSLKLLLKVQGSTVIRYKKRPARRYKEGPSIRYIGPNFDKFFLKGSRYKVQQSVESRKIFLSFQNSFNEFHVFLKGFYKVEIAKSF